MIRGRTGICRACACKSEEETIKKKRNLFMCTFYRSPRHTYPFTLDHFISRANIFKIDPLLPLAVIDAKKFCVHIILSKHRLTLEIENFYGNTIAVKRAEIDIEFR